MVASMADKCHGLSQFPALVHLRVIQKHLNRADKSFQMSCSVILERRRSSSAVTQQLKRRQWINHYCASVVGDAAAVIHE
jgi:hypothetical protein